MGRVLIRNGTVIDTEPDVRVLAGADVLVRDDVIAEIGTGIGAGDADVIDATGMIVLPGFVDTHRHTWQAAIRSTALDVDMPGYMDRVLNGSAPRFRPDDVYAGNLAGALECLDGGITTLVDWSHVQFSPEHTDAAVQGLRDSGIRAVFGYAHPAPDRRRPDEVRRVLDSADGLERVLLAAWGPTYGGMPDAVADWQLARELGLAISVHIHDDEPLRQFADAGLLDAGTNYVHAGQVTDEGLKLIADSGGTVSVTPLTEAPLGLGVADVSKLRAAGVLTALGADAVSIAPGDMFAQMRAVPMFSSGHLSPASLLRMATIDGAIAAGVADRAGSLRPGKQADVVLVRTSALNLAPVIDPVAALVGGGTASDVDTVLVAGRIVKRYGTLLHQDTGRILGRLRAAAEHVTA